MTGVPQAIASIITSPNGSGHRIGKTIARALQTYGAYLRDDSGSLALLAEDSASRGYDAWAKVGLAGNPSLDGNPWSKFRVLVPPAGC